MPKKRINRNFRQTNSSRSATDSARAFGMIQRMEGLNSKRNSDKKTFSRLKLKGNS